jgi:hypothetical protein
MPPISSTTPLRIASIPASAMARSGSPPERGRTAEAMIGANEESGAITRIEDGPTSAYATSATIVAYSPVTAGRPAASA